MADIRKSTRTLNLQMEFADNDDRILAVENPKSNLAVADIKSFEAQMLATQPLRGDKTGAAFTRFKRAYTKEQTVTVFDLA